MRIAGKIVLYLLALTGAVSLIVAAGVISAALTLSEQSGIMPSKGILALNLNQIIHETRRPSLFSAIGVDRGISLVDVLQALDGASADPRVKGLVVRIDGATMGMAVAQELRDAVLRFRKSGKPAVVFSTDLGGIGGGALPYYLATAFDEIWLQPSGGVGMSGFSIESPFLKTALSQIGVTPNMSRRKEFKSAPEVFLGDGFSPEARQTLTAALESWFTQVSQGVAEGRKLENSEATRLMNASPLLANEALAAKLVDRLGYLDEMEAAIKEQTGTEDFVAMGDYLGTLDGLPAKGRKIALVHALGAVVKGKGSATPTGNPLMGVESVAAAISVAADDKAIAAIVLRISSPGGDYVAADTLWREVKLATEKKPVVVSMGDMAASGGYFIAMPATKIVAQPGTLTGSIGVYAGKFALDGLWEKLGIKWDRVSVGENAGMWSFNKDFTPAQKARLDNFLDFVYADFTAKAAEGRKLTHEQLDKAARGRVFSGADALDVGLVDALGGMETAVALAKQEAGLAEGDPIQLVPYPKAQGRLQMLMEALSGGGGGLSLSADLGLLLDMVEAGNPRTNVLRLPPFDVR